MMNKIVTICGSMKFQSQMMEIAERLELENGYIVIQCTYSDKERIFTSHDIQVLSELHYKKIDISDAIYVVNIGGYIGQSTRNEIAYARSLNKEVMFLEPAGRF